MPKMFEKGGPGGPGRPTGSVSLRETLIQMLTPERAKNIVDAQISKAEKGDNKSTILIAELLHEIGRNAPTLALQINNAMSDEMLLERAKRYVGIIDVQEVKSTPELMPSSPMTTSGHAEAPMELPATASFSTQSNALLWEENVNQQLNHQTSSLMQN